jgi:hypothetical protein
MANRHLLHKSKLEEFKNYLESSGWTIQDTKGVFEVLRARHPLKKRPLIIYEGRSSEHLSVDDRDISIIQNFLNCK